MKKLRLFEEDLNNFRQDFCEMHLNKRGENLSEFSSTPANIDSDDDVEIQQQFPMKENFAQDATY